jgi:hypothetical protein
VCGVSEWGTCPRSPQPQPPFSSLDRLLAPTMAAYYRHGGILSYVLRRLLRADEPHKEPHKKVV